MPPPPPPALTDYMRLLMGDVPWSFLLEASLRLVVMYAVLLTGLRLMGKRMAGQLSRSELAALVSLAAAIGIPLLSPDRGIIDALAIATVVVGAQQVVARLTARRPGAERAIQGTAAVVVADGVLDLGCMEEAVLSQERLFAQLRGESLEHLGQVQWLYMEANGTFSLIENQEPKPGLSIIPGWDEGFRQAQPVAPEAFACLHCGRVEATAAAPAADCPHCGHRSWEPAVTASQ